MESGEAEEPVRVSRRHEAESGRIRSKTPIMGKHVPRMTRHDSEELLIGLTRGEGRKDSVPGRLSRHKSGPHLSLDATYSDHRRTASLRRRREKKQKAKDSKKLKQEEAKSQILLLRAQSDSTSSASNVSNVSNGSNGNESNLYEMEFERRESDSIAAIGGDTIESVNSVNSVNIVNNLKMDEQDSYKAKFEALERQFEQMREQLAAKENECDQLKNELQTIKNGHEAEIHKLLVKMEGSSKESNPQESDESDFESEDTGETGAKKGRRTTRNGAYGDLPESDACVMFGMKLF